MVHGDPHGHAQEEGCLSCVLMCVLCVYVCICVSGLEGVCVYVCVCVDGYKCWRGIG
jgi:hypothetical protein